MTFLSSTSSSSSFSFAASSSSSSSPSSNLMRYSTSRLVHEKRRMNKSVLFANTNVNERMFSPLKSKKNSSRGTQHKKKKKKISVLRNQNHQQKESQSQTTRSRTRGLRERGEYESSPFSFSSLLSLPSLICYLYLFPFLCLFNLSSRSSISFFSSLYLSALSSSLCSASHRLQTDSLSDRS